MIIAPELQALRGNDASQRQTQAELLDLVRSWFADQATAGLEEQFLRYAQGEALAKLPVLAGIFGQDRQCGLELAQSFIKPLVAFLRERPLGQVPLRHSADEARATLVLYQSRGAALTLQVVEEAGLARRAPPQSALYTPGETHELVLAGRASTQVVTLVHDLPDKAMLEIRDEPIRQGDLLHRDCARECQFIRKVDGALVSLKLQRREEAGCLTREFDLASGKFLRQATGSSRESRLELATALLGRMGRVDAAPLLAAMAQEEAGQSLRWQSLKECIALDTATGFAALCRIAEDSSDALAGPAGALRAQLLESYPVLQGIAECRG